MRDNVTKNFLSPEEFKGLPPRERGRYVQNLILNNLKDGKEYVATEIIEKVGLARATITKHLNILASTQQISKEEQYLGRMPMIFYKRIGSASKKEDIRSKDNKKIYSFSVLDNEGEQSVCIQQKIEDEYRNPIIKGGIILKFEDLQSFISELHAYGARVVSD